MIRLPPIITLLNTLLRSVYLDTPQLPQFCTVCKLSQFWLLCAKEKINSELKNMNKENYFNIVIMLFSLKNDTNFVNYIFQLQKESGSHLIISL